MDFLSFVSKEKLVGKKTHGTWILMEQKIMDKWIVL